MSATVPVSVEFPQARLQAGVARGDITPPVGIYHRMWGAATHEVSTGVHRPLTATVLTLAPSATAGLSSSAPESGQRRILVTVDHCLLWSAEMQRLKQQVAEQAGIAVEELTVFFSHTHGAGLMGLERRELPGGELIPEYLNQLAQTLAELVRQALATAVPAQLCFAAGSCSLATNRDFWDEQLQRYVCGFNPQGSADPTVLVGRLTDESGRVLLTLVNYACHPTTLAWDNTLISPDYVGALREVVEQQTVAPCFFIQGASGDVGPREGFVGDVAVADRNGRQLGYAVLSTLETLPPAGTRFVYQGAVVSGATIGTWGYAPVESDRARQLSAWQSAECRVEFQLRADLPNRVELERDRDKALAAQRTAEATGDAIAARDARAMAERATRRLVRVGHLPEGQTLHYRARLWRCGDVVWVPLNGEHYNVLQIELRRRFPDWTLIIGTLADGSDVWYLPDADSYGKGLYQEEASILARGSLEQLLAALEETLQQLTSVAT